MPLRPYPITDADYHQYEICFLYHLTHVDNMPSILKHGLLSHNNAHARGLVTEDLSDPDVQDRRADRRLDDRPLHDYVCLYFNPKNPMLFKRRDHQDDIVILCLDRRLLAQSGTFFTDGNAAGDATNFFNDPRDLDELDWDCIRRDYWSESDDGRRKRCAEILVPDAIPFDEVRRVYIRTDSTQTRLSDLMSAAGRQATPIHLDRGMYF